LSPIREVVVNKKYVVRLTDGERAICEATVKTERGVAEAASDGHPA
jgi:hypothetical protein